jgi:uncharacterized protein YjbJ (UPF0337 family)
VLAERPWPSDGPGGPCAVPGRGAVGHGVSYPLYQERTVSSTGDKIKGKANEIAGTVTGDRKRETKGKAQKAKGDITGKAKEKKAELEENEQE